MSWVRGFVRFCTNLVRLAKVDYADDTRAVYVGDNRVLMRAKVGRFHIAFLLEANDRLIAPCFIVSGNYETDLTKFFVRHLKPNSHCIDVGANFGYYACLMASHCPSGRVVALEPDRPIFVLARDNLTINHFHRVAEVINAAASHHRGQLKLYRRVTRSGNTSIAIPAEDFVAQLGEPPSEPFDAPSLLLDDLLPRFDGRVDFIKIDVEGAEPLVLRGAREAIKRNPHLTIVMEWCPGQIQAAGFDVGDFLCELDAMGLRTLDTASKPLSRSDLLGAPYLTGIVLRQIR